MMCFTRLKRCVWFAHLQRCVLLPVFARAQEDIIDSWHTRLKFFLQFKKECYCIRLYIADIETYPDWPRYCIVASITIREIKIFVILRKFVQYVDHCFPYTILGLIPPLETCTDWWDVIQIITVIYLAYSVCRYKSCQSCCWLSSL